MPFQQLVALFLVNLTMFTVGNARTALLPIYITQLGANETTNGIVLALQFFALMTGTILGGWLSDRFQRRKATMLIAGLVNIPAIMLMAVAPNLMILTILIMLVGCMNGISMSMVNTLTGLFADESSRGQTFGIIGSTLAFGALFGGLIGGPIVDAYGFPALFIFGGVLAILHPIAALFVKDKIVKVESTKSTLNNIKYLGFAFFTLFLASNLAYITPYIGALGRPLVMDILGFDSTAVSSTTAVSGGVSLVLTWVAGWLSDRMNRKNLMVACYVANMLGMLLLSQADTLWQFQISTALLLGVNVSLAVGSALVTDIVKAEVLGVGLSLFYATAWIGGVVGYSLTGVAIQSYGAISTFLIGAILPVIAIALLFGATLQRRG